MPRIYKEWYNHSRTMFNKIIRLLRSATWSDGSRISQRDLGPAASTIVLWHAFLVDLGYHPNDAARWIGSLLAHYEASLDDLFRDLGDMVQFVRRTERWGEIVPWFLEKRSEARIVLIQPLVRFFDWRTNPMSFRAVHGIYFFPSKQTFDRDSLEEDAYAAYIQGEESLSFSYDDRGLVWIDEMADLFQDWFQGWDPSDIEAGLKFSSGSTAEAEVGRDLARKVASLATAPISSSLGSVIRRDLPELADVLSLASRQTCDETRFCEVRFVPKTALKKRVIGMEQPIQNFFQNGLDASIRRSKTFPRQYLRLSDQSFSRAKALEGSETGNLATVDFSAASDSVTMNLVIRLCRRCDYRLIQWLDATRSWIARFQDPARTPIKLRKFAAMGSVVCFTIESLVFLAMAIVACKHAGVPIDVAVYGDDVVLPVAAYSIFCEIAECLHFHINTDKSFAAGPFREACGVFAFQGKDVTLPCASRKRLNLFEYPSSKELGKSGFETMVATTTLANDFYRAGMGYSRYLCVQKLMKSGVRFLSGDASSVPKGAIVSIRDNRADPWFTYKVPKAPLFVLSDYEGVRTYDYYHETWLEQPSDLVSRKKWRLARIVQSYPNGSVLPVPKMLRYEGVLVEEAFEGYPTDVGKVTLKTEWTDEERLQIWLYHSTFLGRMPLHDAEGIDLPFSEPLTVERGSFQSLCRKTKKTAV